MMRSVIKYFLGASTKILIDMQKCDLDLSLSTLITKYSITECRTFQCDCAKRSRKSFRLSTSEERTENHTLIERFFASVDVQPYARPLLSLVIDMTLEDPFFVVKDEVFKALNKTRGLYLRWQEITEAPTAPASPEAEWTSTELRNALRSIEWDLEDLEDTISIVEKNSSKFKIDNKELCNRKSFIETTRQEVKIMKEKLNLNRSRDNDGTARQPLLGDESPIHFSPTWMTTPKYTKYSKLANQADSPNRYVDNVENPDNDIYSMQEKMLSSQYEELHAIDNSVSSLKTVSRQIGMELDEQGVMLDELNAELENTDSKVDTALKKVAKVLRMSNDRRQWFVIGVLIGVLVVVLILFIVV